MNPTDSIFKRLREAETERELLQAQLSSVRGHPGQEEPRRQTVLLRNSSKIGPSIDRVTGWLTKSSKQASHSPLLELFTQYDRYTLVFDNIYQRLDIMDVIAFSRTCKRLSSFYRNMLPCRWNINRRLARFVNDPREFRSRLGLADALISGTFALLFFAQLYWLDSGLDIYVKQGSKADALIRYIGQDKSYKFDHSYAWSDNDQNRTLTKVLIFRRIVTPMSPQIRFHLTRTSPLHSILTDCAFSTAHVNIITWDKAYCMFPNITFIDRRMYFLHDPDEAMGQILNKYSSNGWRTSDWADYDQITGCTKPGICEGLRRIGDSATWIIPLNLYKIRPPEGPVSVLESCTFQISSDSGPYEARHIGTGLKTFGINAQTFSCCMLKHTYTFHNPDLSWVAFLRGKLSRMIVLETLKSGDKDLIARTRQKSFVSDGHKDCLLLRMKPQFRRPNEWECVDHMVPAWFEEWRVASMGGKGSVGFTPHLLTVARSQWPSSSSSGTHLAQITGLILPKQEGGHLSLRTTRSKAFRLPPLNLSSTESGPLIPDLITPPPDMPLPAILTGFQSKRSPLYIPSHLPCEKEHHNVKDRFESSFSVSTKSENIFPDDMEWI